MFSNHFLSERLSNQQQQKQKITPNSSIKAVIITSSGQGQPLFVQQQSSKDVSINDREQEVIQNKCVNSEKRMFIENEMNIQTDNCQKSFDEQAPYFIQSQQLQQENRSQKYFRAQQEMQEEDDRQNQFLQLKAQMEHIQGIATNEIDRLKQIIKNKDLIIEKLQKKSQSTREIGVNTDHDQRDEQINILKQAIIRHIRINKQLTMKLVSNMPENINPNLHNVRNQKIKHEI